MTTRYQVTERIRIYRRGKKGTWTAEFRLHGEHQRRSLRTRNRKVAEQHARRLEQELDDGLITPAARVESTSALIEKFIAVKRHVEQKKPATVRDYERELGRWAEAMAEKGARTPAQITPRLEDEYLLDRSAELGQSTRRTYLTIHNVFLNWCESRHYIRHNPIAKVKVGKPVPRPTRPAELRLVNRILAGDDPVFGAIVATLAFTGMRIGELRQMPRSNVDFSANWIHIASRDDWSTKTGASRKVPIHPRLRPHLELLRKTFRRGSHLVCAAPSRRYPDGDAPLNPNAVRDRFQAAVAEMGYPVGRASNGLVLHSIRHFFRSHCTHAGIPERVIDVWMGHVGRQDTGSIYYHLTDEESQAFMRQVRFPDIEAGGSTDGADHGTPQIKEDE